MMNQWDSKLLFDRQANNQAAARFYNAGVPATRRTLTLLDRDHPLRANAEAFIQRIFFSSYQARISHFYPQLLCITENVRGGDDDFTAVAGVRCAASGPLFSEYYLHDPIESVLAVPRRQIVEIGNLSPASMGQARWLIATLNAFMAAAGFTHVVFTAVPKLRNAFNRMGLPLQYLAEADAERLPEGMSHDWGNYYAARPAVFSGDILLGETFLRPRSKPDHRLMGLRQHAAELGRQFTCELPD